MAIQSKRIIMLLTNAFLPDPRVYNEAKSLVKHGYQVTILCWDRDCKYPKMENFEGINVIRLWISSKHGRGNTQIFYITFFWLALFFKLIKYKYEIIHCHDFDTLPIGFIIAKLKNKKIIYDAHESYTDMLINVNGIIKKIVIYIENFMLSRIHLLITVGDKLKNEFKKRGANNAHVIGNWKRLVDFIFSSPHIEKVKKKLGIPSHKIIILFIGWLGKERKLNELVNAVKNKAEFHLIIGGIGPLSESLRETAQKYDNINYMGFIQPENVALYTCISDIVYYGFDPSNPNSKYSAPNKLFEALAGGKAILSGNFGEIGDIVKKFNCGIVIEDYSHEHLERALACLKQPELLKSFKLNSSRVGRNNYNWEIAEKRLIKLYDDLLNNK